MFPCVHTHPHIGRGGQGHVSRGERVSVFMSLSLCECLCVYVSVFMVADLCFCVFALTLTLAEEGRDTYPEVSETSEEREDREPRVPLIMSCHPPTL